MTEGSKNGGLSQAESVSAAKWKPPLDQGLVPGRLSIQEHCRSAESRGDLTSWGF